MLVVPSAPSAFTIRDGLASQTNKTRDDCVLFACFRLRPRESGYAMLLFLPGALIAVPERSLSDYSSLALPS